MEQLEEAIRHIPSPFGPGKEPASVKEYLDILNRNYKIILDSIYDGIIAIDREGKITILNEAAGRLLSRDPKDAIGKHIKELVPNTKLLDVLASGKPRLRERHKVGRSTFLTNRTPIYHDGRLVGAIAVFQDVTAEEELASELMDIKQFVRVMELILDNAYVGIIFCDSKGIIRFMNRMYEELLEIDRKEAYGKHITEYFPDSRLPIVIRTGKPELGWKYNFRGKQTLIVNRIPIKKGNKVKGVIAQCIFKDTSELKQLVGKLDILETKVRFYKKELTNLLQAKYRLEDIIGECEAIANLKKLAVMYARTDSPVLILGETGTGKELFSHAIHNASGRSGGPFVCLNCASIPRELLESELFGYVPGAFTGASQRGKIGKIELADGGTLFLDEIGDLPLNAQAKLLRVLEEKRVERLGDIHPIEVDFRLVAATNKNLELKVKEGSFREELFYRIGTMSLFLPPLRKRVEDIPILTDHFIHVLSGSYKRISDNAIKILKKHEWPGNIRELKNMIERALCLAEESDQIDIQHLPPQIVQKSLKRPGSQGFPSMALKDIVSENEENAIRRALNLTKGNKMKAARLLGISRAILYNKMKRYGIHL